MGTLTPERKIRIAIIGGGLAGATLLRSLLTHPHLSADIYESASAFSERGAAVGLAINAQNALAEMGIADVVQKAGGVRMHSSRTIVVSWGRGPHAGELIFDLASELQGWVVHRAELLRELLGPVPRESMHTNKKVVGIEERDGGIAVSFQDGTVVEADAVIGADGIHGFVRGHVLGEEHPAVKARFAGFWDCRSLMHSIRHEIPNLTMGNRRENPEKRPPSHYPRSRIRTMDQLPHLRTHDRAITRKPRPPSLRPMAPQRKRTYVHQTRCLHNGRRSACHDALAGIRRRTSHRGFPDPLHAPCTHHARLPAAVRVRGIRCDLSAAKPEGGSFECGDGEADVWGGGRRGCRVRSREIARSAEHAVGFHLWVGYGGVSRGCAEGV